MLHGQNAIKQMGLIMLLEFIGLLTGGCGTSTPASSYSSKRSLLGPPTYPAATNSRTNAPVSTVPKPQPAP
jgi:hypothetical protein